MMMMMMMKVMLLWHGKWIWEANGVSVIDPIVELCTAERQWVCQDLQRWSSGSGISPNRRDRFGLSMFVVINSSSRYLRCPTRWVCFPCGWRVRMSFFCYLPTGRPSWFLWQQHHIVGDRPVQGWCIAGHPWMAWKHRCPTIFMDCMGRSRTEWKKPGRKSSLYTCVKHWFKQSNDALWVRITLVFCLVVAWIQDFLPGYLQKNWHLANAHATPWGFTWMTRKSRTSSWTSVFSWFFSFIGLVQTLW